jgi:hypothetical protein
MVVSMAMLLWRRIQGILLRPRDEWPEIRGEKGTVWEIYVSYAAILAGIPVLARLIGSTVIGMSFFGIRYRAPLLSGLGYAIVSYLLSLAGLYLFAFVVEGLAPRFGSEKNLINAMKLSVYASTAYWVAGILFIVPALWFVGIILSLYGLYVLYLGLPVMLRTPKDRSLSYLAAIVIVGIILFVLVSLIATLAFPEGRMGAA